MAIASYPVPFSIYEFAEAESVDEVFRRINSGGRQLSRQELRSAGATNAFSEVVRLVSSKVRGDSSSTDILPLNLMKNISITNSDLDYGIKVDDVFWVKNNIVTRDQLRQSKDEEIISDIISYMVADKPVSSRSEFFDDYFGITTPIEGASLERFNQIDLAVRQRGVEFVSYDFSRVMDCMLLVLDRSNKSLSELMFDNNNNGNVIPRYFQALFLTMNKIIVKNGKIISDVNGIIARLSNIGAQIVIQEGGRWGADNRSASIDALVGQIQDFFEDDNAPDPSKVHWVSRLQNLLMNSKTEQSAYDFKQGFMTLDAAPVFDEDSFEKILKTCVAIANIAPKHKGYVIIGVAENNSTSARIKNIFSVDSVVYNNFYISGIEHEAKLLAKNLDQMFQFIVEKVRNSPVSEPLNSILCSRLKTVSYYDKVLFVFEVEGQNTVSLYNSKFFDRKGAQVVEVPAEELGALFSRFQNI